MFLCLGAIRPGQEGRINFQHPMIAVPVLSRAAIDCIFSTGISPKLFSRVTETTLFATESNISEFFR
jgi:hypothetical protein